MNLFFRSIIFSLLFTSSLFSISFANAMQLEPAIVDLGGEPGEVIASSFSITNEEGRPQTYYFSVQKFLPQGETGDLHFLPPSEITGLPQWTFLSEASVDLVPGERRRIPFTIRLPKGAVRGSVQEVIFVSTAAPQAAGVGLGLRTGLLVFVKIGAVQERELQVVQIESPTATWFSHLPIPVTFTLENKGAAYEIPRGDVVVRNIFGRERARVPFNVVGARLLPQSRRRFTVIWQEHGPTKSNGFWSELGEELSNGGLGLYTVTLEPEAVTMLPVTPLFRVVLWPIRIFLVIAMIIVFIVVFGWFMRHRFLRRILKIQV